MNERCFGDDVAHAVLARLRARGVATDDEPRQEDFGWRLGFDGGEHRHAFVVGLRDPERAGEEGTAIGLVERERGILASLLGACKRVELEAARRVHAALSELDGVFAIEWHDPVRFDRGDEDHERGAPQ